MSLLGVAKERPGKATRPCNVIIVEDEGLYRDLLHVAMSQHPTFEVVGAFSDGESALTAAPDLKPDVAVLDIELGGGANGIETGLQLRRLLPGIGIMILSNHEDPSYLSSIPRESISGWSYLVKKSVSDVATLQRAVQGAAAGFVVLDPRMVIDGGLRNDGQLSNLTPRHKQVLGLIAQGYTNRGIAERLSVSLKSIENQINSLYHLLEIDRSDRSIQPRVKAVLAYIEGLQSPREHLG